MRAFQISKRNILIFPIYDYTIQGMAYLSAAFTIGVKCLGTICHGPTSCRLLFRTQEAETMFEAAAVLPANPGGHFVAYFCGPDSARWYRADDSEVLELPVDHVLRGGTIVPLLVSERVANTASPERVGASLWRAPRTLNDVF